MGRGARSILLDESELSTNLSVVILSIVTVLSLLPFITKSYHIDDPLFVWAAQQIQKHPGDPYGFDVTWDERSRPMSAVTKNPPGGAYYIAAVASVIGWSEPALHVAFMLPAVLAIAGTYLLGRWFCRNATLAALMTLFTPAFLVSASTVMCDVLMLALWIFALYFWLRAVEANAQRFYFVSSLLMPLCALTKYFGITLVPLVVIYTAWKTRRPGLWILHLIIPIAALVGYQAVTRGLYGRGLLTDAAAYSTGFPATITKWTVPRLLVGLAFSGGCVATIVCFSRRLHSWREIGIGLAAALALAGVVVLSSSWNGYPLPPEAGARALIGLQFGILAVGGISLGALTILDFMRHRSAEALLLMLWAGGTFLFATLVNWTTNGRSILPMVPAASFLILRRLDLRRGAEDRLSIRRFMMPLGAAALISFLVTWGDFGLANVSRIAATEIHEKYSNRNLWFEGHWGFQYYMERHGARPLDVQRSEPVASDLIVIPITNTNVFQLPPEWAHEVDRFDFPVATAVSTMNLKGGAGFYSDLYGILPFTLNRLPPETYLVYEVQ